ncbi:MAG: TlpA family protein disulfide reductase [Candidatus Limivicinus sp.]|jgi:thiol-disulfide isomerase/thioredoxin
MKKVLIIVLIVVLILVVGSCVLLGGDEEVPVDLNLERGGPVVFSTTDIEGNKWDQSVFADYNLTMINFWEPFCGPCVGEMPEIQKLYEDYADKGFMVLGVYGSSDDPSEVIADTGVQYPILHNTSGFNQYQSGYVPNTIFVDKDGKIIGDPIGGAKDYYTWEAYVKAMLP